MLIFRVTSELVSGFFFFFSSLPGRVIAEKAGFFRIRLLKTTCTCAGPVIAIAGGYVSVSLLGDEKCVVIMNIYKFVTRGIRETERLYVRLPCKECSRFLHEGLLRV